MVKKSFIFLIVSLITLLISLQTTILQKFILNSIIHKTIKNTEISATYGKIHGFFPINFKLESLDLQKKEHKIIQLKNLNIAFNLQKEFFYIKKINCETVTIYKTFTTLFKKINLNNSPLTINQESIFPWVGSVTYTTLANQTDKLLIAQKKDIKQKAISSLPFQLEIERKLLKNNEAHYTVHVKDSGLIFASEPLNLYASFSRTSNGLITISQTTMNSKNFSFEFNGHYMSKGKFFNIQFKTSFNQEPSKKFDCTGSIKKIKKQKNIELNTKAVYSTFDKNQKILFSKTFDLHSHFFANVKKREILIYSIKSHSPFPIEISSQDGILISPENIQGDISLLGFDIPLNCVLNGNYSNLSHILNLTLKSNFQNSTIFNLNSKIDLKHLDIKGFAQIKTDKIPLTNLSFSIIEEKLSQSLSLKVKAKKLSFSSFNFFNFESTLNFKKSDQFEINASTQINQDNAAIVSLNLSGNIDSQNILIKNLKTSYANQSIRNIQTFTIQDWASAPYLDNVALLLTQNNSESGTIKWNPKLRKIKLHKISLLNFKSFFKELPCTAEINGFIDLTPQFDSENYSNNLKKGLLNLHNFEAMDNLLEAYHSILKNKKIEFILENQPQFFKIQLLGYDNNTKHTLATGSISKNYQGDITNAPLDINIRGNTQINPIVTFLKAPDTIEGTLFYNLKYTGTIQKPNLNGTLKIKNGLYESFINGTYIAHLNGTINVKHNVLDIHNIHGDDLRPGGQNNGVIDITGKSIIHSYNLIESHLILKLTNMLVVKRDDMEMKATGTIKLDGENERAKITGSAELNPATIWLDELTNDEITTIALFENGKRAHVSSEEMNSSRIKSLQKSSKVLFPIDLELKVPNSLYLKGLGVDSLWTGTLHAKGDFLIDVPYLVGSLSLLKGSILFYGKKLQLNSGSILYDEKSLNNPYLKLIMMRKLSGQKLYIHMQGRTTSGEEDSVNFSFSADPSESEKNVLSLIIFGKRTNEITAGQSVQLASIATSLTSKSNQDASFMDTLKNSIGLDVFEFKENPREALYSDTGYTQKQILSVGKDFNDFKVTFNQGIGDMDTKATISKPIGPHLNLDIDVGNQVAGSGGGLSWVYYY